jgi:hypothetical protein
LSDGIDNYILRKGSVANQTWFGCRWV